MSSPGATRSPRSEVRRPLFLSGAAGHLSKSAANGEGQESHETPANGGVCHGLSHCVAIVEMERAKGFEPSTSTLARLRSTRLSYARFLRGGDKLRKLRRFASSVLALFPAHGLVRRCGAKPFLMGPPTRCSWHELRQPRGKVLGLKSSRPFAAGQRRQAPARVRFEKLRQQRMDLHRELRPAFCESWPAVCRGQSASGRRPPRRRPGNVPGISPRRRR